MKQLKRLFYYLLINILVSACTTLVVLSIWQRAHPESLSGINPFSMPTPGVTLFATGTSTVEPTPTRALVVYQVKEGDTLSEIAIRFRVELQDLLALNHIQETDPLAPGQALFVPAPVPTMILTSGDTETPSPAGVVIISNVFGAGDLTTERVRLERSGEGDVPLAGWQISDENGNTYTFPELTLFRGGSVDLYSGVGANSVVSLYWGLPAPIWTPGETVTLKDPQGEIKATFKIP